jgi:hypothetical protein
MWATVRKSVRTIRANRVAGKPPKTLLINAAPAQVLQTLLDVGPGTWASPASRYPIKSVSERAQMRTVAEMMATSTHRQCFELKDMLNSLYNHIDAEGPEDPKARREHFLGMLAYGESDPWMQEQIDHEDRFLELFSMLARLCHYKVSEPRQR